MISYSEYCEYSEEDLVRRVDDSLSKRRVRYAYSQFGLKSLQKFLDMRVADVDVTPSPLEFDAVQSPQQRLVYTIGGWLDTVKAALDMVERGVACIEELFVNPTPEFEFEVFKAEHPDPQVPTLPRLHAVLAACLSDLNFDKAGALSARVISWIAFLQPDDPDARLVAEKTVLLIRAKGLETVIAGYALAYGVTLVMHPHAREYKYI